MRHAVTRVTCVDNGRVAMARRRWKLEEAEMLRQEAENRQYRQDWLSHELLRSHVTVPLPERSVPKLKSLVEDGLRADLFVPLFWSVIATEAVFTVSDCIKEASFHFHPVWTVGLMLASFYFHTVWTVA